LFMVVLI